MSFIIIRKRKSVCYDFDKNTNRYSKSLTDMEDKRIVNIIYNLELAENLAIIQKELSDKEYDLPQKWQDAAISIVGTFLTATPRFKDGDEAFFALREDSVVNECFKLLEEKYKKQLQMSMVLRNALVIHKEIQKHKYMVR